jgi:hypothetical protein
LIGGRITERRTVQAIKRVRQNLKTHWLTGLDPPAVSASVVVAITNACAIPYNIATLAAKKSALVRQSPSSIRGAPPKQAHLHHFASVANVDRDVPVTAARSPSCEPDHYDLDRPMRYDLGNVAFARRILHQQAVASRE